MQKIKFITDSASDIPDDELRLYDITMLNIPIIVDGVGYREREDFSFEKFYTILEEAKSIPKTSHILNIEYVEEYKKCYEQGYTDIIVVSLCGAGSNMFQAASMAVSMFFEEMPDAKNKISIHVLDSKTYSMVYGFAVLVGARMSQEGESVQAILDFLNDYFDSVESYFSVYSLAFAKKSGRISVAAAFIGEALGLRPILSIIDSEIKIVDKVRGDRNVVPKLVQLYKERSVDTSLPMFVLVGSQPEVADSFNTAFKEATGKEIVKKYMAGASITINSGPKIIGIMLKGKSRINKA
ncbi:MAG: DegV family protein [Oscillospiraceae bacterium]